MLPADDVGVNDRHLPLREEADLDEDGLAALLRGISDDTGIALRTELVDCESSLDDVAHALAVSTLVNRWQITITFEPEEGFATRATAVLKAGLDTVTATGAAHKNPADPYVVDVGHDVAAARALLALAHQLLDVATTRITEWDDNATALSA
jgi:hypothetical protein